MVSMLPTYQQLYDLPKSLGATVDFVPLTEEEEWRFDSVKLVDVIQPNTKMICLNSANNPTGTLLDRQTLEEIIEIAEKVDAYILMDEVYAPLAGEILSQSWICMTRGSRLIHCQRLILFLVYASAG